MKKIFIFVFLLFAACTPNKSTSQAPVYSITDNSVVIVADGGANVVAQPENKTEQTAKPNSESKSEKTDNMLWLLWAVFGLAIIGAVGYIAYKKGWFSKVKTWIGL